MSDGRPFEVVPRPTVRAPRTTRYPFEEAWAASQNGEAVRFPLNGSTVTQVARAVFGWTSKHYPAWRGRVRRDGEYVVVWMEPRT